MTNKRELKEVTVKVNVNFSELKEAILSFFAGIVTGITSYFFFISSLPFLFQNAIMTLLTFTFLLLLFFSERKAPLIGLELSLIVCWILSIFLNTDIKL